MSVGLSAQCFPQDPALLRPPRPAHSGLAVGFALFTVDGPLCLAPVTCSGLHPVSVSSLVFQQLSEKPCSSENLRQNIMAHCVGIEFWTEHYLLSEFSACCSSVFWYPLVPFLFLSMTRIYFLYFVLKTLESSYPWISKILWKCQFLHIFIHQTLARPPSVKIHVILSVLKNYFLFFDFFFLFCFIWNH